ncbi:MAM and LDL-receptor class A domain-containing protein 1 [Rhinatrema bivittatum]|uniref:MAM and LDL-receptor class A domain-containing protein 1 n=1 Tax=Rhinatrema bivittatum TaxID=194408 RepID=UPI00112A88BA|nr:MAM and LDL-receptor class A domain-containing protein 1 [Rhinatrema bivittatum]
MDKIYKLFCSLYCAVVLMIVRPCIGNEFQCRQGLSVPSDNVCDFTNQCGDNSDEEECSLYERCDFETSLCNMTLDGGFESGWRRTNGLMNLVPYSDHNGNPNAYVLSLSSRELLQPFASLRSILFLPTDSTNICQMRFYYYFGRVNGILKVGLQMQYAAPFKGLWKSASSLENVWKREVITIKSTEKFQIIIQGAIIAKSEDRDSIAIDDISFSEGCLPGFGKNSLFGVVMSWYFIRVGQVAQYEILPCKEGFHICNRKCILDTKTCDSLSDSVAKDLCSQDCDFEHNTCCWISKASDEHISWVRRKARGNLPLESGPAKDHSKGDAEGHYVWVDADQDTVNKSAFLNSPVYHSTGQKCRFQFHYYIEEHNNLRLLLYTNKKKQVLLETNIPTNNQWITGEVNLPTCLNGFQLIFEGTIRMQTGSLSLDNLQFFDCGITSSPALCSPEEFTCASAVCSAIGSMCDHEQDCCNVADEEPHICIHFITCDFESGLCGWKPLDSDDSTWKRTTGRTSNEPELSKNDQIIRSEHGSFIYFNGSLQPDEQLKSYLSCPSLIKPSAESALCQVIFWYRLSKDSQLSVFTRTAIKEDLQTQSDIRGPSKSDWTKANIFVETDIGKTQRPFQIILQATLLSPNATIAIDDISITPECVRTNASLSKTSKDFIGEENFLANETSYCSLGFYPCQDGTCILLNKLCDFTPDCQNGIDEAACSSKCDFENDNCGWFETVNADAFDWIRSSRSDLSDDFQKQAPPYDHTYKQSQGHFMFILKNSTSISQVAELRSPRFSQSGSRCTMSFWYYNYGLSVGAAEMHLLVDGMNAPTVLWRIYYDQGNQWLKAFIQLGRISQPFQLSLNKVSLGFYDGISAIDDIAFENCSLPPAVASCEGPDYFWCHDTKACIDSLMVCDLVDDCGDGSDEDNCSPELQCNFENGLCNWKQDFEDDFDWTLIQGPTSTLNTGPMKDHTLGTVMGHYLYIESSEPQVFQNQAVLLSPVLAATTTYGNKSCIFRLHYHMFGKHIYSLAIYKRILSNTKGVLLWQTFANKGNRWLRKTLYISSSYPFQVLVKGTVGDGFTGDIGIDDLSFMDCTLYNGTLPEPSTVTLETSAPVTLPAHNCTDEEFFCRSTGHCISAIHKCDFRADCSDGSDEFTCVMEVCDFESGNACEWYQPTSVSSRNVHAFQWSSGKGASIHPGEENHRPSQDHTMNTEEGLYLYADSSNGQFGNTADIITPIISLTGPKCKLVFWSHMNGATVGTLQVLIKIGNETYILWSQTGKQGPQWKRAEVFLGIRSYFQIILRAKRGVSYMGDVSVDDISFEDCSPLLISERVCTPDEFMCANKYCIPKDNLCDFVDDCADNSDENSHICNTFISRCNFEFDLCAWEQNENDDFNWNLRAGSTPIFGTGPAIDHTLHNPSGHYIFIESSFPQLPRQTAKISSPLISRRSKNCKIIFYYQISGISAGSLTIYQVTVTNYEKTLLNFTGDQGNFWQRQELTLIAAEEDFRVTFEGNVGRGEKGHIALDDIFFTKECLPSPKAFPKESTIPPPIGSCPHGYWACQNGKCFRPEQSCNFVDDCGDNTDENECGTSCTFEKSRCGWQNSLADNFDWIMGAGSSQSLRPPRDHTLGNENGHFMYLEATPVGLRGEKAHLKSSNWKESSTTCTMSFWYYMSSKATGRIHVLVKTDDRLSEIWRVSENQGEKWNKAEIHLGKLRNFEIIFEGIRAKDLGGGAAIDDIEFKNCTLIGEKPGICPEVTDFVCWNKKCIESHFVCDYKPDCEDSSDEMDCSQYTNVTGSCNFETPEQNWTIACGLQQDSDDSFDWTIGSNVVMGQNGHLMDHTPGNGQNFLYINSSAQQEGATARILTTTFFPASLGICRIRFWFYIDGSRQMGTLKLYIVEEYGLNILMWSATGHKEKKWIYANMVLSSNGRFRVAFEAEVDGDNLTDIALDDISFTPECVTGEPVPPQPSTCSSDLFSCVYEQQCVPLSAKCNGKEDCEDGTDEMMCPSGRPSSVPPRVCQETEFQCAAEECIPSLLRCDGVPDCQLKEDEFSCGSKECFNGSLLCQSNNTCVPVSQRCDGVTDCIDFSLDESSCSECPVRYCQNGGTCVLKKKVPLCQCKEEWTGNRCHIEVKPSLNSMVHQNAVWISFGVGITCLLISITVAVFCFLSRKKVSAKKSIAVLPNGFVNPLYDEQSICRKNESDGNSVFPEVKISVSPWQAHQEHCSSQSTGVSSFSNPLYSMTS